MILILGKSPKFSESSLAQDLIGFLQVIISIVVIVGLNIQCGPVRVSDIPHSPQRKQEWLALLQV